MKREVERLERRVEELAVKSSVDMEKQQYYDYIVSQLAEERLRRPLSSRHRHQT